MKTNKAWFYAAICIYLIGLFFVNWQTDRSNFGFIASFYTLAFAGYVFILKKASAANFKYLAIVAVSAQVISMLFEPSLSNDYFRFIWDGEMFWNGINPFDFKPNELTDHQFMQSPYMQDLYGQIAELSQRHYSCYPPVNQLYFILSTAFFNSIASNALIMRLLVFLTEVAGAIYLVKLLKHLGVDRSRIWMLYLNPLWIVECTGNLHFEAVMISLLFIALYHIVTGKILIGAIWFGLAVQIKLVPLLILPFFFRYFSRESAKKGFWRAALLYMVTILVVVGLGFTQLNQSNVANFLDSLRLYFSVFEFNSFLFYNYIEIGKLFVDYNPIRIIGPYLSNLALIIIVYLSLKKPIPDWKVLFERMMMGYFVYLMLSSTLHPWYALPMLSLSLFTNYSFPLLWSFLIFFSYFFYSVGDGSSLAVRALVTTEYAILIAWYIYERRKKGSGFDFLRVDHYLFQPSSSS